MAPEDIPPIQQETTLEKAAEIKTQVQVLSVKETIDPEIARDEDTGGVLCDTKIENGRQIRGTKWVLVCLSLYVTIFVYGLDTTIAAAVQGAVVEEFHQADQLAWLGVGFPLGSVASILPIGFLYTQLDQKWLYIATVALFEVGSAICGGAPNMNALIIGRVVAGIGGTGMYLGGLNYFSALTTHSERGVYLGIIGTVWGAGAIIGPLVGGKFSEHPTWRWAFYVNLIVGAIFAPIYLFQMPSVKPEHQLSARERLRRFDVMGTVLSAIMWVTLVLVLTLAGHQWAWSSASTILTWVIFGVSTVCFIIQQGLPLFTTKETRAFPVDFVHSRTHVLLYIGTAASVCGSMISIYYTPIYFQFVHGDGDLTAAVRLIPYMVVFISCKLLSGALIPRFSWYFSYYILSGVFQIAGGILLHALITPDMPVSQMYGFLVLVAAGAGITDSLGYTVATIQANNAGKKVGLAIAFQNIGQLGGVVLSLAIAGQVFQSTALVRLQQVLVGQGFSAVEIQNAVSGADSTVFQSLTGELRQRALYAITGAMEQVWILVIVSGVITVVAGLLMKKERAHA